MSKLQKNLLTQFAAYFENRFNNCGPSFFYITFESIFESVCQVPLKSYRVLIGIY